MRGMTASEEYVRTARQIVTKIQIEVRSSLLVETGSTSRMRSSSCCVKKLHREVPTQ